MKRIRAYEAALAPPEGNPKPPVPILINPIHPVEKIGQDEQDEADQGSCDNLRHSLPFLKNDTNCLAL